MFGTVVESSLCPEAKPIETHSPKHQVSYWQKSDISTKSKTKTLNQTLHVLAIFPHTPQKNPFLNSCLSPAPNSWRSNHGNSDGLLEESPDHHPPHESWEKKLPYFSNLKQRRVQGSVFSIAWSTKHTYLRSFTYKHLILNGTTLIVYHNLMKTTRKQHCRSWSPSEVNPSLKP